MRVCQRHVLCSMCLLFLLSCKDKKNDPNSARGVVTSEQSREGKGSAASASDPTGSMEDGEDEEEERPEIENTPLELLQAASTEVKAEATENTEAAAKTQREAQIKEIQRSFQQQTPELFDCLRGEIHENAGPIALSVSAKLSPAGRVTTASVSGIPSYLDRACVETKARNMHVQNPVNEMVDVNAQWLFDLRAMPH